MDFVRPKSSWSCGSVAVTPPVPSADLRRHRGCTGRVSTVRVVPSNHTSGHCSGRDCHSGLFTVPSKVGRCLVRPRSLRRRWSGVQALLCQALNAPDGWDTVVVGHALTTVASLLGRLPPMRGRARRTPVFALLRKVPFRWSGILRGRLGSVHADPLSSGRAGRILLLMWLTGLPSSSRGRAGQKSPDGDPTVSSPPS